MIGLHRRSRKGSGTVATTRADDHTASISDPPMPPQTPSRRVKPRRRRRNDKANLAGEAEHFGQPRRLGSVQQNYVSAEAVIGDVLVLAAQAAGRGRREAPKHEYRAILEVSSVNYALKTEGEQEAILAGYRAFLNGLTFPLQVLVQVRPLDLAPYLARLHAGPDQAQFEHATQAYESGTMGEAAGATGTTEVTSKVAASVWIRLAQDEERYVLDLAAQRTLLERHFYLVIPANEGAAAIGGIGGAAHAESSLSEGAGMHLPEKVSALPSWLPFPGRRRRHEAAAAREVVLAAKQLTLRAQAIARELERVGLETHRLSDEQLVAVYHRAVAPDAAARFPIQGAVLAGIGQPATIAAKGTERGKPIEMGDRPAANQNDEPVLRAVSPDAFLESLNPDETHGSGALERFPDEANGACGDLADVLAPASISLTRDDVRLDDTFCRTLAVVGYPRHVYPGWLERLIDLDEPLDVVLHIHPQSTGAMIRQLSHRLVQLHSSRLLNEERGRVGHPELGVAYRDVEQMRERLQRGDERIFATSFYIHVRFRAAPGPESGKARRGLNDRVARIETELANQQLVARPATFEQDLAFLSCLPEGRDRLLRTRLLDTSSLATAFPFVSNSLSMPGGILLGTTANGSPVFIDAFAPELENANKVVFAKSGAGKSYACKIEALRSLLRGTDVYVVDPEAEYEPLASAVGGQTVRLAAGAHQHLNPFDLPAASEREVAREAGDVLADKVQSLHALLDLMLADRGPTGTAGLSQREKGLLDRALYEVYRRAGITSDPATHLRPAPLLRDLHGVLVGGDCGTDDSHLAERLHRYVYGSLSGLFAAPTNVELSNRLVVFDVRDLDAELRPLGLFLIAEFVWTRIRRERRPRLLVIDEAWTLMQYAEGGRFLAGLARRARKYYLGLVTITQDAQDFLSSEHGRTVLANSSVQLLMKQDSSTIEAVSKAFRLSTGERQYVLGCHKGEGLLFARGGHVALQIGASPFEHELATTDPRELAAREQAARYAHAAQATAQVTLGESFGKAVKAGRPRAEADSDRAASTRRRRPPTAEQGPRRRRDAQSAPSVEMVGGAPGSATPGLGAEPSALTAGDDANTRYEHPVDPGGAEDVASVQDMAAVPGRATIPREIAVREGGTR